MFKWPWVKWYKPWRRCGAHLYMAQGYKEYGYWGRCELDKSHEDITPHALERGMDIVEF